LQITSAEGTKRGGEWAWLLNTLGHGAGCTAFVGDHYRVYRSCETVAVRRSAARPFVRYAQSAVRLPESRSRLRLDRLSGSRMALLLVLNEWPRSRSTDSVGLTTAINTIVIC